MLNHPKTNENIHVTLPVIAVTSTYGKYSTKKI